MFLDILIGMALSAPAALCFYALIAHRRQREAREREFDAQAKSWREAAE